VCVCVVRASEIVDLVSFGLVRVVACRVRTQARGRQNAIAR
jgi:hypothetical protein